MNTINEWSPLPKNKDWRKNAEKAKNVSNPEPNDGKKGWGLKTNKKKECDWYQNESRNMNEKENWQDAYAVGKKIVQSRRVNGSKQYRTIDAPKKQSKFTPTKYTGASNGSCYTKESVAPKTLIRITESDLHRIVKESVQRILKEDWADDLCNRLRDAPGTVRNPYPPKTDKPEEEEEYTPFYNIEEIYKSGWCDEQIAKLFKTFGRKWPEIIARRCGVSPEKYTEKELAIISNTNWMSRGRVIRDIQKYNETHNTSL